MGGGCFPAGTKVKTINGDVDIENIKVGDMVLAFNDIKMSFKPVTETFKHAYNEIVDRLKIVNYKGGVLTATGNHYIATPSKQNDETDKGFARVDQLEFGDIIYLSDGIEVEVLSLDEGQEFDFVYNFEVDDYHTYIADGIRVHNGGGGKKSAAKAQTRAAEKALKFQGEQFDYIKNLIAPYEEGGEKAFMSTLDLLGLGTGSQTQAINNLTNQPYFQELLNQGEQGILANASATGGLRGGNTQAALAQFRPNMIQQLVQQQLQNLGGITNTGMSGVSALAGAGQNFANQASQAAMSSGQGQAQAALAPSGFQQALGTGLQIAGVAGGLGWSPF